MYGLEVRLGGSWVECVDDDAPARVVDREDAEAEARFSLDDDAEWRVVEVQP